MHIQTILPTTALAIAVVLVAPTALAGPLDGLLPPMDVQSDYYEDTNHVRLSWTPVEGADYYNVYRNGEHIGSTTDPWYTAELRISTLDPVAGFQVTSVHVPVTTQSGPGAAPVESSPSAPIVYGQAGPCEFVTFFIDPDDPPFVSWNIHPECFPPTGGPSLPPGGNGITTAWRLFS